MVRTSTLTYFAVRQDAPGAWSIPAQRESCYCFSSCSPGCKAFSDASSVVSQPIGDPYWAGVSPFVTHSVVAATPDVSANAMDARTFY